MNTYVYILMAYSDSAHFRKGVHPEINFIANKQTDVWIVCSEVEKNSVKQS